MKRLVPLLVVVVVGIVVWLLWPRIVADSRLERLSPAATVANQPPSEAAAGKAGVSSASGAGASDSYSPFAASLNAPEGTIQSDLSAVAGILETFRTNFLKDGNPVGDNADITAALTGRNPLQLALLPPNHRAINQRGELCDRWGTPFFFHAESATRMEIRSAGPDRKMWSADDVVHSP